MKTSLERRTIKLTRLGSMLCTLAVCLVAGNALAITIDYTSLGTFTSLSLNQGGVTVTSPGEHIIDYRNLGTFTMTTLNQGGITTTGSDDVNVLNFNGLGVVGGTSNSFVDTMETLSFAFDGGPAENVSYHVQAAVFGGDAFIEAFDASNLSLGTVSVSGAGPKDVSALFSNQLLSGFSVTAVSPGEHLIGSLGFEGLGHVNVLNFNGLGVVGGTANSVVDTMETLSFAFDGGPAENVSYHVQAAVFGGDAFIEAFDASNLSLGTVSVSGAGPKDVSALFSNQLLSGFSVTADSPGEHIISSLSYELADIPPGQIPEPSTTMLLFGTGLAGLLAYRWKTRKQT